jgi:hypothetical protein
VPVRPDKFPLEEFILAEAPSLFDGISFNGSGTWLFMTIDLSNELICCFYIET